MNSFLQDVKFALRSLSKNRRFSAVSILTLGLGLGATVAIFGVVRGVLLRSLPYERADRLVFISQTDGPGTKPFPISSPGHFRDYREKSTHFQGLAAGATFNQVLDSQDSGGQAEQIDGGFITANFLPLLGVTPALGRNFLPEEEVVNGPRVIILSDGLWRRRYGADPGVLGKQIKIGGNSAVVVGILPPGFKLYMPPGRIFLRDAEFWVPAQIDYTAAAARRQAGFLAVIGRLKDGVTLRQAQAEMDSIAESFRRDYRVDKMADLHIEVVSMLNLVVRNVRPALLTIMAVVVLVLIIACANVANLFLARAAERKQEIAVRIALGASRGRVVRQILTEGLVLAFLGLGLGLLLAEGGLRLLLVLRPSNLPRLDDIHLDVTAIAFAIGATLVTALLFGVIPALSVAPEVLRQGRGTVGVGKQSVRSMLIVGEIAASLVLLITAGLLLRSFAALQHVAPGFTTQNIITFQTTLPFQRYTPETGVRFYHSLEEQLRALPGVQSVGAIGLMPLDSTPNPFGYASEAAPDMWAGQAADTRIVTPDYFKTMGVRLRSGRVFTEQDTLERPLVVMVDDKLAEKMWPGQDALGKKLNMTTFHQNSPPTKEWWTVIGVVDHTRNESLTEEGMVEIYRPLLQDVNFNMTMVIRHATDPIGLQKSVAEVVHRMDSGVPLHRVRTIEEDVATAQAPMQFNLVLIGAFAVIALVLASVGLYGVIAYLVAQRTREIGVRIALDAQKPQIFRLVLSYGIRLTALGLVIGVALALGIARLISSQLFAVKPTDLTTFVLTSLVLGSVAMLASYFPSHRAANVDPIAALRNDGQ